MYRRRGFVLIIKLYYLKAKNAYLYQKLLLQGDIMSNKKTFIKPIIEIINFDSKDIITYSNNGTAGDDWSQYKDTEEWGND